MDTLTATPEITTEWTEVRRDGQYYAQVPTASLLAWFHAQFPQSMDWQLTNEGYSIHPVAERIIAYIEFRDPGTGITRREEFVKPTRLAAKRAYMKLMREREGWAEVGWTPQRMVGNTWMEK